jgi:hypothetical protein
VNNTNDKNRTVRPRTASKDIMTNPTKTTRRNEPSHHTTIRTVSRSIKNPAKQNPEKRLSAPQKSTEKSTLGKKFACTVMQPAFEQVSIPLRLRLIVVTTTVKEITCRS